MLCLSFVLTLPVLIVDLVLVGGGLWVWNYGLCGMLVLWVRSYVLMAYMGLMTIVWFSLVVQKSKKEVIRAQCCLDLWNCVL